MRYNPFQTGLFDAPTPKAPDRFIVVPRDGRFMVCRRLSGTNDTYDVVDDCRTEAFAKLRAEAMNAGTAV